MLSKKVQAQVRVAVALCCLPAVLATGPISETARASGEADRPSSGKRPESSGGPYCGVYCLYAALHCLGKDVRFADILDTRYIGSVNGSSLAELRRCASDFGAEARAMQGLTAASLRAARQPVILHVRRPGKGMPFNHWVLFLGIEGEGARIVDPPGPVETWPLAEVLALWDGIGLVLADGPPETAPMLWASWSEQATILALAGLAVAGAHLLLRHRLSPGRGWTLRAGLAVLGCLGLVGLAGTLGVGWHVLASQGLLANRAAVALVVGRHFDAPLPSLTLSEVAGLVGREGVIVIDARLPGAYDAGHLPGAINLPITAGLRERDQVLASVPPAGRVVVYCQSDRCPWAQAVASDIAFRGYRDVVLFPGGWEEWRSNGQARNDR